MKQISILFIFFIFSSCIPLQIAPTIKEDKVKLANRFKWSLPKEYAFIFKDPKDANKFFKYIDARSKHKYLDADWSLPVIVKENEYFFTFYEVEKNTRYINLLPFLFNSALNLDSDGDELDIVRKGSWYIALTVSDKYNRDCLNPKFKYREEIIQYLKKLRIDYLNSSDYNEVLMRK